MASIACDKNGCKRILFVDGDGKRRTVRLGQCDRKTAESVCRHIEALLSAKLAGQPVPQATATWLGEIGQVLYDRLASVGLVTPSKRQTLGELCGRYLEGLTVKPASRLATAQAIRDMKEFFGENRDIASITAGDCEDFKTWMLRRNSLRRGEEDQNLSPATVAKRLQRCRAIFHYAVKHGWISKNPFCEVRLPLADPKARQRYIPVSAVEKLIDTATDPEWKLLLAMARYLGIRIPSEAFTLTWDCVDWAGKKLRINSPKTATVGRPYRIVPLLPQVEKHLAVVFEQAEEGTPFVFARLRRRESIKVAERGFWQAVNLRQQLLRLCQKAMIPPWPRLWQNLRSSAETDLCQAFPVHVAAEWLGHSRLVASKHYLQVTDADFERALNWTPPDSTAAGGIQSVLLGGKASPSENTSIGENPGEKSGAKSGALEAQNAAQQVPARIGKLEKISPQPLADFHFMQELSCRNSLWHKDIVAGTGFEPVTSRL